MLQRAAPVGRCDRSAAHGRALGASTMWSNPLARPSNRSGRPLSRWMQPTSTSTSTSTFTPVATALASAYTSAVATASASASAPSPPLLPRELPLFPVQPVGVFLPGMTKTLHLYEPHFLSLLEEAMTHPQRLMATAVLEPHMGEGHDPGLGGCTGGYNFSLSCGCLVQVLSAKPYTGGYLVRIRGEGRLGIRALSQSEPYMRAQVYPLPDLPPAGGLGHQQQAALKQQVEQLNDIMRDVQNLASKFRCDETAALQQAMRWMHAPPLLGPGMQLGGEGQGAQHGEGQEGQQQQAVANGLAAADSGIGGGGGGAEVAEGRAWASGRAADVQGAGAGGQGSDGEGEEEEETFDPELAVRLSWAALQWLPHASVEERMRLVRSRLLAMDTRDVGRRLALAAEAMGEGRAALAAKCAIMGAE